MKRIAKFLTAPWLVFLVLGGVLYALVPGDEEQPQIYVSRAQIDNYLQGYLKQFPVPYTPELEQRLLQQLIDEEALLQEALANNFQALPVVQDRLRKLGAFVQEEGEVLSDEELVDRAIGLGLLQSDPVIRRYLVSVMERALVASTRLEISEAEINDYYQQHLDDFEQPARADITHVFFSEDQGRNEETAQQARLRLQDRDVTEDLDAVLREGDVFYSGHQFRAKNQRQLASIFGSNFSDAVFQQPAGAWSEPIRSAYGWHLVWPENLQPAATLPLDKVEDKVIARIRQDKEKALLQQRVELLRQHYDIVVEENDAQGGTT